MIYRNWDGYVIDICHLNRYKKPILCVGKGNEVTKVACFSSEEAAQEFEKIFEEFVNITHDGGKD